MSHFFKHPARALLLAPFLFLAGCAVDSAGPVQGPLVNDPALSISLTGTVLEYSSKDDPRLLAWLEREKLRIDFALKSSQRTYDSLKVVWNAVSLATSTGNTRILYCEPLSYAASVKIVGPTGATFVFGPHRLMIPYGALKGWTVVTAEAPVGTDVEAKFAPHGLQFLKPSNLDLSYRHCLRPPDFGKKIVYVDSWGRILETFVSNDKKDIRMVDAWIRHFSSYLVAY
jgi:hypothetical protein